jgi:hypothetical protein
MSNGSTNDDLVFQFRGQSVPVTKSAGVTMEEAQMTLRTNPFRSWVHRMETSISEGEAQRRQVQIRSVELQSVDLFGARGVGFCKIKSHCTLQMVKTTTNSNNNNNEPTAAAAQDELITTTNLPGICLLRGDAVAILVALFCTEDNTVHSLLVEQPR